MPAKGQDIDATSIFLARLIGPVCLVIGVALLINGEDFRTIAGEFIASPALIFFSGIITMPAGLAIVLTHNLWVRRLACAHHRRSAGSRSIGGAVRILAPQQTVELGRTMLPTSTRCRSCMRI